jgi:hypothetical protein
MFFQENFMNRAQLLLALAGLLSISGSQAAQPGYVKAYDAGYDITSPAGKSTLHQMSDGKGHMRSESTTGAMKTISIMDFPGKVAYTVMAAQKMYMKTPMTAAQETSDPTKQPPKGKSLGAKVIDSHPCHGYESGENGAVSQVWIGDDIQNLVHSETKTAGGKTVMALKSYDAKAPAQDLLLIPAGCKEMKMPTMPNAR